MTEPEWNMICNHTVKDFWPNESIPLGRARGLYRKFRYYHESLIRVGIEEYYQEHPDERFPRKLWSFVKERCERGDQEDSPENEFGHTGHECKNIRKALFAKLNADQRRETTPGELYDDWCRRTYPQLHGAPFSGSIDSALAVASMPVLEHHASQGKLRAYLDGRAARRRWYGVERDEYKFCAKLLKESDVVSSSSPARTGG